VAGGLVVIGLILWCYKEEIKAIFSETQIQIPTNQKVGTLFF
jgi:hypothetical protein